MMYVEGYFVGGNDRYSDSFRNQKEFEWCIDKIRHNGACEFIDTIVVNYKVPKYVREFVERVEAEGGEIKIVNKNHRR